MKATLAIIFGGFMIINGVHSNNERHNIPTDDSTKIIGQINAQYEFINERQTSYRILEKDLISESTEGGFVAAYKDRQTLRKLRVIYYGETGKVLIEDYFNHNELFFSFAKEYHYNKPIDQPGSKVTFVKEDRCYFTNKRMIRWMQGDVVQKSNSVAYKNKANTLLSESNRLFNYMFNCKVTSKNTSTQDTVRCKYGSDCPSTGYVLKGSRDICGEAIHVNPKNKKVTLEQ